MTSPGDPTLRLSPIDLVSLGFEPPATAPSLDRSELVRVIRRHGLPVSPAVFEIEENLADLITGHLRTGITRTLTHLEKEYAGDAYLARAAAGRGLVPWATKGSDRVLFVDSNGVVSEDLDLEYFGPVADDWRRWLRRRAWVSKHFRDGLFVAMSERAGEHCAEALSLARVDAVSDPYDVFWSDGRSVIREQRVSSRYEGTTLLAGSLNEAVRGMIALHERRPDGTIRIGFEVPPLASRPDGLPLVLRAKGKREGVHYRDRGELRIWGWPGHYIVELDRGP